MTMNVGTQLADNKVLLQAVLDSVYKGNAHVVAENDRLKVEAKVTTERTLGISVVWKNLQRTPGVTAI